MSAPLPISADAPAIVGRIYLVPCLKFDDPWMHWAGKGWLPILGPRHEDAEIINFKAEHYHFDIRFLSPKTIRDGDYRYSHIVSHTPLSEGWGAFAGPLRVTSGGKEIPHQLAVRPFKCYRANLHFPTAVKSTWPDKLREKYAGCPLKDGLVCPHRGFPLAPFADAEGIAICPGHGLAWNLPERRLATPEEETAARLRAQSDRSDPTASTPPEVSP